MIFNYLLDDSQSDARTLVVAPGVEPLKHLKNPLGLMRVEANAVIHNLDQVKQPVGVGRRDGCTGVAPLRRPGRDNDAGVGQLRQLSLARCGAWFGKLQRVADQVLKQLPQLTGVARDGGEQTDRYGGFPIGNGRFEINDDVRHKRPQIDRPDEVALRGHPRIIQHVFDEHLHPGRCRPHPPDHVGSFLPDNRRIIGLNNVAEGLNFAQRLLQIVARYVSKLLQVGVGALQVHH